MTRYKVKSMDHVIQVTDPHIFYEVDLCVTLIHYPKYNISNSLPDKKRNHWTIKYRLLTYIYSMRSITVSHWSIIPTMLFIHQIILKILSKITRPWNIGHVDLYLFFWGQSLGHTESLSENMTLIHQNSLGNIRQNHWTMKYRSQWPSVILRSNVVSYWLIIPNNDVHTSNSLQDICIRQISGPWNISHSDLHLFWGQTFDHIDS